MAGTNRLQNFLESLRNSPNCTRRSPWGVAGGAALGPIGGNAGEGTAIGAGALFGLMRRARWAEAQTQQQRSYVAQQPNALVQGHAAYNRVFATCMSGYIVSM